MVKYKYVFVKGMKQLGHGIKATAIKAKPYVQKGLANAIENQKQDTKTILTGTYGKKKVRPFY